MKALRLLIGVLMIPCITGCGVEKLPARPFMGVDETLRYLAEQSDRVKTVTAEGTITLTRANGDSVRFDGAMVMQPPGKARIRAWKFGQAVFDLTINDQGMWLVAPEKSSHAQDIRKAGTNAGELAKTLASVMGQYFQDRQIVGAQRGDVMEFSQKEANGTLRCEVDRRTLTARKYVLVDERGQVRFSLSMEKYAVIDGIPWPKRMVARSDAGTVQVDLNDVELNGELAPGAFVPPKRAERIAANGR